MSDFIQTIRKKKPRWWYLSGERFDERLVVARQEGGAESGEESVQVADQLLHERVLRLVAGQLFVVDVVVDQPKVVDPRLDARLDGRRRQLPRPKQNVRTQNVRTNNKKLGTTNYLPYLTLPNRT